MAKMRALILNILRCYRFAISGLLGHCCRFDPSCSTYAMQAVEKHGCLKGCWLAAQRVAHCHPWHPGGSDPVP